MSGLRLSADPLKPGETVQIAVAAGDRVGLSSGTVGRATGQKGLEIDPIARVRDLVHVSTTVSPGASGAPAVDASKRVRGFVVAGSSDLTRPDTFIYPAVHWHAALTGSPRSRAARSPAKKPSAPRRRR